MKGSVLIDLCEHVQSQHTYVFDDFEKYFISDTTLNVPCYRSPVSTSRAQAWLAYIVMTLSLFSTVECKIAIKNLKYEPISANTLHEYDDQLARCDNDKLPERRLHNFR